MIIRAGTIIRVSDAKGGGFRAIVKEVESNASGWHSDRNQRRIWFKRPGHGRQFMNATVTGPSQYTVWDSRFTIREIVRQP